MSARLRATPWFADFARDCWVAATRRHLASRRDEFEEARDEVLTFLSAAKVGADAWRGKVLGYAMGSVRGMRGPGQRPKWSRP